MRRCATAASSTKPCLTSHLRVWMISLRRSGQRALFVRPHERHIGHAAPSTLRREKDQIKKLRAYYPTARLVPNIDVRGGIVHASWRARYLDSKTAASLDQRFGGIIATETDLRKIVGPANRWFTSKILKRLDRRVAIQCGGLNRSVWLREVS